MENWTDEVNEILEKMRKNSIDLSTILSRYQKMLIERKTKIEVKCKFATKRDKRYNFPKRDIRIKF